jgi:hypothetical protein
MAAQGPIFLLGMARRTGTNFGFQLLSLHRDVAPATRLPEDFAAHDAHLLLEYARRTRRQWNPRWGFRADAEQRLVRSLGGALLAFLVAEGLEEAAAPGRRPLFKTPSVQNLEHFFELFPEASLLILVRDGRDVVESTTRSFGASREAAIRAWGRAAREVCDFDRRHGGEGRHRIVRYEDLVRDPEATLRGLFAYLGLDAARYDFAAARDLPVFGSSTFRGENEDLHWQPVAKSEAFRPLGRFDGWSPEQRCRFAWLAGDPMRALGYELEEPPAQASRWRQRLLDAAWELRERARRAAQRTKRA